MTTKLHPLPDPTALIASAALPSGAKEKTVQKPSPINTISGPLIVRKNAPLMPEPPLSATLCKQDNGSLSISIAPDISADDLFSALKFANKTFDSFVLTGSLEFQASFCLLARGLGAGHKTEDCPFAGKDDSILGTEQLRALAQVAQAKGHSHHLPIEVQSLTDGGRLAEKQVRSVKKAGEKMGLTTHCYVSQSSVSRYVTVSKPGSLVESLEIRISDHGHGTTGKNGLSIGLKDSVLPVVSRLERHFGVASEKSNCR